MNQPRLPYAMKIACSFPLIMAAALGLAACSVEPDISARRHGIEVDAERALLLFTDETDTATTISVRLFNRSSPQSVDGGEVRLNDFPLLRHDSSGTGVEYTEQARYSIVSPVNTAGLWNVLNVAGSASFPVLADSIRSPDGIDITEPAIGAEISRHVGCTVRWAGASAGDTLVLRVADNLQGFLRIGVPDNGSVVLTPRDLNMTLTGDAYIIMSRRSARWTDGQDGMRNLMSVTMTTQVQVKIVP